MIAFVTSSPDFMVSCSSIGTAKGGERAMPTLLNRKARVYKLPKIGKITHNPAPTVQILQ